MAAQGRDIKLSTGRIEGYRNFITKLWNASRYAEINECASVSGFDPADCTQTVNQWIVGALVHAERLITQSVEDYRFNDAANAVYQFTWHSFCDWYLEFTKPILMGDNEAAKAETRATTAWVLDQILHVLHPFAPYVTEELWEQLAPAAGRAKPLISDSWPVLSPALEAPEAAGEMDWLIRLISEIRAVRSEMNVPAKAKTRLLVQGANTDTSTRLQTQAGLIERLARVEDIAVADGTPKGSVQLVLDEATYFLPLGDVIDVVQETARLQREIAKFDDEITTVEKKLGNEKFVSRAPVEVVEENRERLAEFNLSRNKLKEALERLAAL